LSTILPISTKCSSDHYCLEIVLHFVDIGVIVDHHCLEVGLHFVDIGVIVAHHYLEVVLHFVDIGVIVDHHQYQQNVVLPLHSDGQQLH
jgi:hypothetical protein